MSALDMVLPGSVPSSSTNSPYKSTGSRRSSMNGAAAAAAAAAAVLATPSAQAAQSSPPSPATLVISPYKPGRVLRTRPLSRDTSKEALQQHADLIAPAGTGALAATAAVSSPATSSSLATTSFTSSAFQPHPPGSPAPPLTLLAATTTSVSTTTTSSVNGSGGGGGGGGGQRSASDDTRQHLSLPAVGATAQPSPSLTASLLAAASKDSTSSLSPLQLPQIVQAQQARLTALESLTSSQGESIVELQRTIRNLQKQLVFVMAAVPSTSGTGGVSSLQHLSPAPPSSSRSLHGALQGQTPVLPYRSRSSTELRYARQQQSASRLSSGSSAHLHAADRIVAGMNVGSHSDSMESLPHSHRSHLVTTSRPTSKTNSRYNSPRNNSSQQQSQQSGSATTLKASSHHFSFHPTTPSTQPPPGQLHVDHSAGIVSTARTTPAGSKGRSRRIVGPSSRDPSITSPAGVRPSRRLTPVEGLGALGPPALDAHTAAAQSTTTATISIGHAHATISATTYPARSTQLGLGPGQQSAQLHSPFSPNAPSSTVSPGSVSGGSGGLVVANQSVSPGSVSSVDGLRPLPVQHTVTRSKHGVTEYVLSFRDGQAVDTVAENGTQECADTDGRYEGVAEGGTAGIDPAILLHQRQQQLQLQLQMADHSAGGGEYRELSPRSAALDLWKAQQLQAAAAAAAAAGRKDKKSSSRRAVTGASGPPPAGSTAIDMQRDSHRRVRSIDGDPDDPSLPTGVTAAALLAAKKARKKDRDRERETRKVCKVAGCGEARSGPDSKYCRAHSGPAPLNPNARKMMFHH